MLFHRAIARPGAESQTVHLASDSNWSGAYGRDRIVTSHAASMLRGATASAW